ncbi:MAG: efflux RND transporter permease subunit, partial [Pseudomonadota bacterium]
MDPIRFAIERPIAVVAAVIMAVLFGLIAVTRIPIQLAPDVRKPVVVISTNWPGAAPAEVEREIINPQEEALRGLDGLEIMTSRSRSVQAVRDQQQALAHIRAHSEFQRHRALARARTRGHDLKAIK